MMKLLACLLLAALLAFYASLDISTIELVLIIVIYSLIVVVLTNDGSANYLTEEHFAFPLLKSVDIEGLSKLTELPGNIKGLIVPPIDELINNATPTNEKLKSLRARRYIQSKDPQLGGQVEQTGKGPMGDTTTTKKYVLQEDAYNVMKKEYVAIDQLLSLARDKKLPQYGLLFPSLEEGIDIPDQDSLESMI
jgi:hypothetical protein